MFNEAFKVFGDFKTPVVDFNSVFEVHRRNFEALTAANQVVSEGVQAIARRQAEVFRTNVDTALNASKEFVSTSGTPEVNVEKQAALTKTLVEKTLSNVREVSEMATKSSFEAFDVLNKRAAESFEELNKVAANSKK